MSAYVIFIREMTKDAAELEVYSGKARASFAGHTVKPLAAYGKFEVLEGPSVEGAVIVEFPSMAEAKNWYDSPSYVDARAHRLKGADYRALIVEGLS